MRRYEWFVSNIAHKIEKYYFFKYVFFSFDGIQFKYEICLFFSSLKRQEISPQKKM